MKFRKLGSLSKVLMQWGAVHHAGQLRQRPGRRVPSVLPLCQLGVLTKN